MLGVFKVVGSDYFRFYHCSSFKSSQHKLYLGWVCTIWSTWVYRSFDS